MPVGVHAHVVNFVLTVLYRLPENAMLPLLSFIYEAALLFYIVCLDHFAAPKGCIFLVQS